MSKKTNIIKTIISKASFNRKLYVFIFCLVLSSFFWILNALSKKFIDEIAFNVSYINVPINKVVLNDLPNQITLKIKGLGFDLLAYKLRLRRPTVIIDIAKVKGLNNSSKAIQTITLASTSFLSYISNQLGEQIEIKEIYPDAIKFLFDEKVEKKVRIIPLTTISFEKQYQQFGKLIIKPAVALVSGPSSIMDTLNNVYTESLELIDLSESVSKTVHFNSIHGTQRLIFNPQKAILYVPVEKFTETSVTVSIKYLNVPDSIIIKAIPKEITVKFLIPLSKMASLESAKFIAAIDYNQMNDTFNSKLKVELKEHPDYIQSYTLNPAKVEYILKKRNY